MTNLFDIFCIFQFFNASLPGLTRNKLELSLISVDVWSDVDTLYEYYTHAWAWIYRKFTAKEGVEAMTEWVPLIDCTVLHAWKDGDKWWPNQLEPVRVNPSTQEDKHLMKVMIREFLTNYLPPPSFERQLAAQSDAKLESTCILDQNIAFWSKCICW